MLIETVSVKNFRSIENASLQSCGRFNTLVGRNNSGKSNVLSAMKEFFWVVDGRHLVRSNPKIGRELDFFETRTDLPIEITVTFSLDRSERQRLHEAIIPDDLDVPGVDLVNDRAWHLAVRMRVMAGAPRIAFVSKVSLTKRKDHSDADPSGEMLLLEVPEEAAREIAEHAHNRAVDAANLTTLKEGLDSADWNSLPRRLPSPGESVGDLSRALWRRYKLDAIRPPLLKKLDDLVRECLQEGRGPEDVKERLHALTRAPHAEPDEPSLKCRIRTLDGESDAVPDYVAEILVMLGEIEALVLPERRDPVGQEDAARLYRLYGTRREKKMLRSIIRTISDVIGVEVDPCLGDGTTKNGKPTYELDIDEMVPQASGAGIRQSLRLLLDNELEPAKVVLIEEPEIHLHPELQRNLARYLKKGRSDCQVFVSTHSPIFVDGSGEARLYMVSKAEATKVRLLSLEPEFVEKLTDSGIDVGAVTMHERLVFVQDHLEEHIIREFANALKMNLSLACVGFVPLNGRRGIDLLSDKEILPALHRNGVETCFVTYSGEMDGTNLTELRQSAEASGAYIPSLERSGIENYLLSPKAVLKFVREKQEQVPPDQRGAVPSEKELADKIHETAQGMKGLAFARNVARRLLTAVLPGEDILQNFQGGVAEAAIDQIRKMIRQLEERKTDIGRVTGEEESRLDDAWKREPPEWVVPGDLLLKRICEDVGVTYQRSLGDGVRLAALMDEDEIPRDIERMITEIGEPLNRR